MVNLLRVRHCFKYFVHIILFNKVLENINSIKHWFLRFYGVSLLESIENYTKATDADIFHKKIHIQHFIYNFREFTGPRFITPVCSIYLQRCKKYAYKKCEGNTVRCNSFSREVVLYIFSGR